MARPVAERTQHLTELVRHACLAEVLSPKPGNVTPTHDFADSTASDFIRSATAAAPVQSTRAEEVGSWSDHSECGYSYAPAGHSQHQSRNHSSCCHRCVAFRRACDCRTESAEYWICLTIQDAVFTYRAIRMAQPGGLGQTNTQDVNQVPDVDLKTCMSLAADRDIIAKQYTNGFADVLENGLALLQDSPSHIDSTQLQIQWLAVRLIAQHGDSLIARKCGAAASNDVQQKATDLLKCRLAPRPAKQQLFTTDFDQYICVPTGID